MSVKKHSPNQDLPQVSPGDPILSVKNLYVETPDGKPIIEDVTFELGAGEAIGVVGESGSGKTTAALALLGSTQSGAKITSGRITIAGREMDVKDPRAAREMRGKLISYVPQNPGTALNPSLRIGPAIREMIAAHHDHGDPEHIARNSLENVSLPGDIQFQRRYPHQLSGGQQQRVCISVALVSDPPLVILDEPTTGLDVVTQARVLEELLRLRHEQGISMVYVTHDLAVVAQVATRIAVMYGGRMVEEGPANALLRKPGHPYTKGLLTSIPDHKRPRKLEALPGVAVGVGERPTGCSFAPRCSMAIDRCTEAMPELQPLGADRHSRCLRATDVSVPDPPKLGLATRDPKDLQETLLTVTNRRAVHRSKGETVVAAEDISFTIARGRCVALVGESGSGKTTIGRTIVGLHPVDTGEIKLGDETLPAAIRKRSTEHRRRIQMVFQNPADALNPRHTVRSAIARPASILRGLSSREANSEVDRYLDLVRLPKRTASCYPSELSGGEKQRVGIARALVAQPELLICDEVTSALDVSVQAAVLDLLANLGELRLALLFITHDLGVVATVADEVLVLDKGRIAESGPVGEILREPRAEYTQQLLDAAPSISDALADWDRIDALNNGGALPQPSGLQGTQRI